MLLLYTPHITERITYAVRVVLDTLAGIPVEITTNEQEFLSRADLPRIAYTVKPIPGTFHVPPHPILRDSNIRDYPITCFSSPFFFESRPVKGFFSGPGPDFPFDVFAACFYLLTRYEEYLPHKKDKYGRYDPSQSVAAREGFLHQPMANVWAIHLRKMLKERYPQLSYRKHQFQFLPTYDIDIAYAFLHRPKWLQAARTLKDWLNFDGESLKKRKNVLKGLESDPYDAYAWLRSKHEQYELKPLYFMPMATNRKGYDRNLSPLHPGMQQLVTELEAESPCGLHPSWQSYRRPKQLATEKARLEAIVKRPVYQSRQHYLRFTLPETYRELIAAGITEDYSMGYGTVNGFRASVASAYLWFDLVANQTTPLTIYPFCFMDANAFYEQQITPQQAYSEMRQYFDRIETVDGLYITIWHNHFLGNEPSMSGWREAYHALLSYMHRKVFSLRTGKTGY